MEATKEQTTRPVMTYEEVNDAARASGGWVAFMDDGCAKSRRHIGDTSMYVGQYPVSDSCISGQWHWGVSGRYSMASGVCLTEAQARQCAERIVPHVVDLSNRAEALASAARESGGAL